MLEEGKRLRRGVPRSSLTYAELAGAMPAKTSQRVRFEQSAATYPAAGEHRGVEVDTERDSCGCATAHGHRPAARDPTHTPRRADRRREACRASRGALRAGEYDEAGNPSKRQTSPNNLMPSAGNSTGGRCRVLPSAVEPQPTRGKGCRRESAWSRRPAAVHGAVRDALRPLGSRQCDAV